MFRQEQADYTQDIFPKLKAINSRRWCANSFNREMLQRKVVIEQISCASNSPKYILCVVTQITFPFEEPWIEAFPLVLPDENLQNRKGDRGRILLLTPFYLADIMYEKTTIELPIIHMYLLPRQSRLSNYSRGDDERRWVNK